jgi:hypothetical protein
MNYLNIWFNWCSIDDCYRGLNNINGAFHNIESLELYNSDSIQVESYTGFIPWKILVLLWYYLDILNSKNKNIIIKWAEEFLDFLKKCWVIDFVNNQEIDYKKLKNSVIIPFCKVSDIDDLEYHFWKLIERTYFDYDTVNIIMQFLWELHNNSRIHWHTNKIYIMWQYYPTYGKYDVSIYDDWEWIKTSDINLIDKVYSSFIDEKYKKDIEKKFWFNVLFIILCVSTRFSTKWPNIWGLWLYDLSSFLCSQDAYLNIASWKEFIKLKFNKVCDKLDNESIEINNNKLNNEIKW